MLRCYVIVAVATLMTLCSSLLCAEYARKRTEAAKIAFENKRQPIRRKASAHPNKRIGPIDVTGALMLYYTEV